MKRQIFLVFALVALLSAMALPAFAQESSCDLTADEYREQGLTQYQADDVAGAAASFACVTELDPEDAVAFNNLGFFYGLLGEFDLAYDNYATAETLDPTYPLTFTNRADLNFAQQQYDAAIADFEKGFALNPDGLNPLLYNEWGLSLYYTENSAEAIEKYDAALALAPDYVQALSNRGFAKIDTGNFDSALADFEATLKLNPDLVAAYIGIGDVHYVMGRVQLALDAYQTYAAAVDTPIDRVATRITELAGLLAENDFACPDDGDFESFINTGNSALQRETYDMAIGLYGCAIEDDPDNALGYNNRGFANFQRGTIDLALPDLNRAIELDPELQIAYHNRGQVYYSLGNLEAAITDLEQSIELDNSLSNESFATLGFLYTEVPDFEAALPYLTFSANAFTVNPDVLANLAFSYLQLERYEEAFLAFEQLAVAIDRENFPANIEALVVEVEELTGNTVTSAKIACEMVTMGGTSSMARQFKQEGVDALQSGDLAGAIEKFNCAIEFNPFDSFAYNNRGLAQFQLEDYEAALISYAKSLELNPWEAQTYSNRGYLYNATQDYALAAADFDQAIKLDPDYLNAYFGRAEMFVALEQYEDAKADLDTLIELLDGGTVPPVVSDLLAQVESNLAE